MSRASGLSPFASCQFRFSHALLRITCLSLLSLCYVCGEVTTLEARLPSFESSQPDSYFCMSIDISDKPQQLMGVEALAHKETVHHILLFGCEAPSSEQPYWPCREHGGTCGRGEQTILFGWGQDAPPFRYEEGRSMSVGEGTKMSTIVMQVHFLTARPKDDASGVKLTLSDKAVDRAIGMIDFIASFTIPPGLPQYDVPVECCYRGWEPVQPYAIRVHAHDLAKEIWLDDPYRRSETAPDGGHVRLYTGDPSLPQSFYRVQEGGHPVRPILPGQTMQAICRYNSSTRTQHVHAGWTHADEMCNLYMMAESQLPVFSNCFNFRSHQDPHAEGGLPRPSEMQELPQADAPLLQWAADAGAQAGGWQGIGQVSAVHEAPDGTVWLLHRGEREWDGTTFDEQNRMRDRTMIAADVIVQLNASSGTVLRSFGAGWLSMPHGLTVDWDGNLWITDCGLHQVIKVDPEKQEKVLEIGTQLEPGHDLDHFCKPTNVAPGTDGTVWVSDGYCNARLLQLSSKDGKVLQEVPLEMDALRQPQSRVIHDVVLNECDQRAYVADREEGKILVAPLNEKAPELAVAADLSHLGIVWGLALGPYGTVWALVQKRGKETSLVVLEERAMGRLQELRSYKIENSGDSPIPEPHDLALGAAPSWITGPRTRYIALYITETGGESYAPQPGQPPADHVHGRLRKMVLTHAGFQLPSAGAAPVKTSAPDADPGATPAATRAAGVTPAATAQPEAAPQSSSAAGSELSSAPADEAAAPDPASSRALPAGPQHAGTGSSILQQPPASAAGEQKAAAAAAATGESGGGADDGHAAPATPPDGTGGGTAFQVAGFRRGPAFGAGLAKSGRPMEEGINPGVALMLLVTGMAVTALAVHLWQNANGDRPVQYHPVSSAPGPQSARPHLSAQGH